MIVCYDGAYERNHFRNRNCRCCTRQFRWSASLATVARQLVEEKQAGEKVDAKEYKRPLLTKQSLLTDRSIDLDTGEQLKWHDMIPVISWLMLRGKSRYSGKPIGLTELLLEVGMAVVFTLSVLFWPAPLSATRNR